jgi:eukaryotic-like serine/threonine-protein kinase
MFMDHFLAGAALMHLDCPHCGKTLEYSGIRPLFCAYCGKGMAQSKLDSTAAFPADASTPSPDSFEANAEPEVEAVGAYRLIKPLGAGGMGTVYEAVEVGTERRVALKLIAAEHAASQDALERFRREGRLASAIAHPRCVFVLAADEQAGRPYIVMELMPGATLKDLVEQRGALPPQEAIAKILDVIDGLREAHRLGVIHRDVKPSNCFLDKNGRVKIGDFGLSKSLVLDAHLTRTGSFVGTPLFASPEQVRGEGVDQKSDVYSVAATLYCLLTGRAPFQGSDAAITLVRIASDPVPPMRTLRPALPQALDDVVLRGLERDRLRRWANLDELREALLPFVPGQLAAPPQGLRFGAFLIDYFTLVTINLAIGMVIWVTQGIELGNPRTSVNPWQLGLGMLLWALWWGLSESMWSCSLGKWLLGLRVRNKAGTARAAPSQIALRLLVFYVLANLGSLPFYSFVVVQEQLTPQEHLTLTLLLGLLFYPLEAVGIALIVCTMRWTNGYRGLHEFASGTRVVRLPAHQKRRSVGSDKLNQTLTHPAGLPQRIGAYAVKGALRYTPEAKVLLGEDATLQREVLIYLRPVTEPPTDAARRELSRPTRLRWLAGSQDETERWDAFMSPPGRSLRDLVNGSGSLPWSEVRPLLEQLAAELNTAGKDDTVPAILAVDQVRVQSNGQVQLLDWPLRDEDSQPTLGAPQQQALSFLGHVAVLALEGRPWRPDDPRNPRHCVRAPVPEHAASLLAPLLGLEKPYRNIKDFECELAATAERPTEVTRGRRAAQLAVLTLLVFFAMCGCMMPAGLALGFASVMAYSVKTELASATLKDLEQGAWRDFALSTVNPDLNARLCGFVQLDADLQLRDQLQKHSESNKRELQARYDAMSWPMRQTVRAVEKSVQQAVEQQKAQVRVDLKGMPANLGDFRLKANWHLSAKNQVHLDPQPLATMFTITTGFWLAVWVIWAFLWRGGLSYRWLGLSLVRANGRKAARWQCALRALLVWAPVVGLWMASLWLEVWYWSAWPASAEDSWLLWLSWGLWWVAMMLLAAYACLAILYPRRTVHDWMTGIYLVPR